MHYVLVRIVFTVPTTCSGRSIEMFGFMYLFFTVPTTCSRPSFEMVALIIIIILLCRLIVEGLVLKWFPLLLFFLLHTCYY